TPIGSSIDPKRDRIDQHAQRALYFLRTSIGNSYSDANLAIAIKPEQRDESREENREFADRLVASERPYVSIEVFRYQASQSASRDREQRGAVAVVREMEF